MFNSNLAYEMFGMKAEDFFKFTETRPYYEHWELIEGLPFNFAGPTIVHQKISFDMSIQFAKFFEGKSCTPLYAPVDVILFEDDDSHAISVCQPDILVYCNEKQNDGKRIHGAPELVVEIWSESNDEKYKLGRVKMFKEAGIKEIWEVDFESNVIRVTSLVEEAYTTKNYEFNNLVYSEIFPGLFVDLFKYYKNEVV